MLLSRRACAGQALRYLRVQTRDQHQRRVPFHLHAAESVGFADIRKWPNPLEVRQHWASGGDNYVSV
jgi:hypothetical protein